MLVTSRRRKLLLIVCAVAAVPALVRPTPRAGGGPVEESESEIAQRSDEGRRLPTATVRADGYTSARVCGQCHKDIYNSWKKSLHAFSLTDPIFDTAYMQAVKEGGDKARRLCLHCHAPMTMVSGDYELEQGVSREGVSCDFCHTVTAVHLDGRDKPYSTDPGLVKRGVIKKAASPAHQVAFSQLHGTSEFCGGCHNYRAPSGSAILGTYDEWRSSPYANEGVQCQDCHMVLSVGKVVSDEVGKSSPKIHLHSLVHDRAQLREALAVEIISAERREGSLVAEVVVKNVGSGHMVPTGIPSREVVLEVSVESGGHSRTQERRYRKVVGDERGRHLTSDYELLLRGAVILNDNRIGPREARTERFRFPVRGSEKIKVTATLSYRYAPVILRVQEMNVELGRVERFVF